MTPIRSGGRRGQRGQSLIVVALSLTAILSVLALVVNAGYSWTTRRHLQSLADAAALSGATYVGLKACGYAQSPLMLADAQTAFNKAQEVLDAQLGSPATPTITGDCPAWHYHADYPGNVHVHMNFPYLNDPYELEVIVNQVNPLFMPAFSGSGSASITGRAVARHKLDSPTGTFALFARQQVTCQGNVPVNVSGSIYAGQGFGFNGNCYIYAHKLPGTAGATTQYLDFGNIISPQNGQTLGSASAGCAGSICADGYEWFGSTAPSTCGLSGPSGTQYLDSYQYANPNVNPNPCAQGRTAPVANFPTFDDPMQWAISTHYTVQCDRNTNYGSGPAPTAGADGYLHYHPGCYSDLTISGHTFFDPGLYYFNGKASGQGLILPGGSQTLAKDVTFEFVNNAGFNTATCGSTCSWGADPALASPDPSMLATGDTYFAAPPADGSSSWCTSANHCPMQGLLAFQGPTDGYTPGTWAISGPHAVGWFRGTISFQSGACTWWANGTSQILGQFACDSVALQGGAVSVGGAVDYGAGSSNVSATESALVE